MTIQNHNLKLGKIDIKPTDQINVEKKSGDDVEDVNIYEKV